MSEYIITDEQIAENRRLHGKKLLVMPVIVRCRDCKYYEMVPEDSGDWCEYWTDRVYRADGFCAWGERREP